MGKFAAQVSCGVAGHPAWKWTRLPGSMDVGVSRPSEWLHGARSMGHGYFCEDERESPELLEHAPAHAAPLSVTSGRQRMGRKKAGRARFSCPEFLPGQAGEPEG